MTSLKISTTIIFLLLLIIIPKSSDALCKWYGFAPFCFIGNSCPSGCGKTLESKTGDGSRCWISHKNYCCCLPRIFICI
ncbi:unnamed protein product [Rotaria sp. Silwood1]|nr:unnamed protein product [Rotaria sp. Silwood1]CAF1307593.1 unnamed protein product [Rotaria sp. Silwood1]CAF1318489.1 unnamed protein product [Rotaria sp. Silwood1]CAF3573638.1 unnamed protein product [Rotaria sp. Silwood1]CAF3591969.1 unnamed protein product [Rotaria sp. Silwood1]